MAYNYDSFDAKEYDLATFRGPQIGSKAPDFEVQRADGTRACLLDFKGEFLVLEMGSLTCPLFQGRRAAMSKLDRSQGDVTFAVLYIREAHPGDKIGAHGDMQTKQAHASDLADSEGRLVLVDALDGHIHAAYGSYPNSVFIINRNGCVVWATDWNNTKATARALALLKAGKPANVRAYFKPVPPSVSLRVLGAGGRGALPDFLRSLPRLVWNNFVRRNLRLLLARKPGVAPDTEC